MKNISAILFLFMSVSIAQKSDTEIVEESKNKMGIGFEFHTWPTTMLTTENDGINGLSIFFPIHPYHCWQTDDAVLYINEFHQ